MENVGLNLLIGAALTTSVGQAFASIKKQTSSTIKDTEKIQLGKKWAEELLYLEKRLKANDSLAQKVGRDMKSIKVRNELINRLAEAKREAEKFGINLKNAREEAKKFTKELAAGESLQKIGEAWTATKSKISEGVSGLVKAGAAATGWYATISHFGGAAVNFEKGMAKVSTLVNTNEVDMKQLSKNAKEMAKSFGFSTSSVSEGMYQALSAGVEVKDLGGFMETAGKMAVGGSIDMATAINGMTSAVNAYKNMNLSAEEASDIMFQTAKRGKTDVGQLAASLSNVTPIASSIGVKFGDVSAAIATLTYSGTPTATATTEIAAALTELSKEGTDASKTFKRLSGQSFKDYIASGHNLGEAFNVISQGAKMQGKELVDLFGNVTGAKAVMTLTGAAAERFGEDLTEMGSSAGASEEAFKKMDETTSQKMAKMQAAMEDVKLTIGEALLPSLSKIGETVASIMRPIGEFIAQHQDLIENLTWATAVAIGFYGVLKLYTITAAVSGLIKGLVASYQAYQKTAKGATIVQWAWNTAMKANPIGTVITLLGIVIGLGVVLYKNWDSILNWFKEKLGFVGELIGSIFGKTDKLKADIKKEETDTIKVEKDEKKTEIGSALKDFTSAPSEKINLKSVSEAQGVDSSGITDFKSFTSAPATSNKTVNVTISNFTVNAHNIEEALPKIVDRVREAIKQGIKDDMENSYAY